MKTVTAVLKKASQRTSVQAKKQARNQAAKNGKYWKHQVRKKETRTNKNNPQKHSPKLVDLQHSKPEELSLKQTNREQTSKELSLEQ
jgi:hypothetical protein